MKPFKKGLFSKYIMAFLLITLLSFVILAVMFSSMIGSYASDSKNQTLQNCANSVKAYLDEAYARVEAVDLNNFIFGNDQSVNGALNLLADNYESIRIMVLDTDGQVLCTTDNFDENVKGYTIPVSELSALGATQGNVVKTDFNGMFDREYKSVIVPLNDASDEVVGCIAVSSDSSNGSELMRNMIKTMIIFALWILAAALIVLYFIAGRITEPLREMSRAAREYAAGKFDVRVPVKGNDEISDLAIAFNNMADALSGVETQRSLFLANVAHDLRTPMTTIAGFIDGILAGAIPQEKQAYYLELIASEVRRLSRLVSSLLDITRIQAGERKFTSVAFDICEMARQILISFEKSIDEKKLNVEFLTDEDSMMAYADRDAIYQVLYNICHNAVKFSRVGGLLCISIKEKNKKIFVSVKNEGDGIPSADLPYVFDRFYKSDKSRGLDKTGVGLGLYIVKAIINAHKEEIWVDSVEGENCTFSFTLQPAGNQANA